MFLKFYYFNFEVLSDRTATQYDRLLAWYCRLSCLSVCLWRCALWL